MRLETTIQKNETRNDYPKFKPKNKKRLSKKGKFPTVQAFTTFLINQIACTVQ